MSRSFKKHGVIKDIGLRTYNRIFRRVNKQRINMGLDPKEMKEVVNQYDVCDYRQHWDEKWWKKIYDLCYHRLHHYYSNFARAKRTYFNK